MSETNGEPEKKEPIILDPYCPVVINEHCAQKSIGNRKWRKQHQAECKRCQKAAAEYETNRAANRRR